MQNFIFQGERVIFENTSNFFRILLLGSKRTSDFEDYENHSHWNYKGISWRVNYTSGAN